MNWINNVVRPKIQRVFKKKAETPDNLWRKCPACNEMIFHRDLDAALNVCPHCGNHMKLSTAMRLSSLFDGGQFQTVAIQSVPLDPLKFRDQKKYPDRLKEARAKTGREDSVTVAHGPLDGIEIVTAIQDFAFMGGSLGMAAGEAIIKGAEVALEKNAPYVLFAASGGARMQEGIMSLMQMPRTTVAVQMLRDAGLLCHARRHSHRRTRCPHRLFRSPRYRTDDPRKIAGRFPACRVPVRSRHDRHDRAPPSVERDFGAHHPHPDASSQALASARFEPACDGQRLN